MLPVRALGEHWAPRAHHCQEGGRRRDKGGEKRARRAVSPPTGAAGDCTVSVSQPAVLEADFAEGAVTVPCFFSTAGCRPEPPTKLWFRLGAQKPETLCVNAWCSSKANKFTVTEDLARNQTSLTVSRLTANDSAIYICGIAVPSSQDPRAKQTGAGTVLVVRGGSRWRGSSTPRLLSPAHASHDLHAGSEGNAADFIA